MGNRAIIIFENEKSTEFSPAVYLHWNGGPESVYQFLDELDYRKVRGADDLSYQTARFIQICGEFMDQDSYSGLSLGVESGPRKFSELDQFTYGDDHGIYLVYRNGENRRVRRFYITYKDGKDGIEELTPAKVKTEKDRAYRSDYFKDGGFRANYAEMHNNKPVE